MRRLRRLAGRLRRDDCGDGDVAAMVVVIPLAFGLMLLFVMLGRQGVAAEGVTHAAAVAARAASMERNTGDAHAAATTAAASTLSQAGTSCTGGPSVAVSASTWDAGGVVSVTVTCQIDGIGSIGASTKTVSGSARATIDAYRTYGTP
jgi:Flp pilus assembly protein TadG